MGMQLTNKVGINLLDYLPTGWIGVHEVYKYITVDDKGWVVAHKEFPVDGISDACYALHLQVKKGGGGCIWSREGEAHSLSEMMRIMRAHKGWTQADLAERIGVTQAYIAQQEARVHTLGHLRLAKKVSAACEIGMNISIKAEKVVFSLQPYH